MVVYSLRWRFLRNAVGDDAFFNGENNMESREWNAPGEACKGIDLFSVV